LKLQLQPVVSVVKTDFDLAEGKRDVLRTSPGMQSYTELVAVRNSRASGNISMIRSCRNCQRWFYAITNHQAYCIDSCRQQFHSRDLGFKEKRRLYMRWYRNDKKKRELATDLVAKKNRLHSEK
jgi:hypothetical protein